MMIAGRGVWDGSTHLAGLHGSRAVGGARVERIGARQRGSPLPGPERPGVRGNRRLQRGRVPGEALIGTHLHFLDATRPGEGDAADIDGLAERHMTGGTVDARHGVDWPIVPALVRVDAADEGIGQLDARQPFGIFFAIAARDEYAQGEAMTRRKLDAVRSEER